MAKSFVQVGAKSGKTKDDCWLSPLGVIVAPTPILILFVKLERHVEACWRTWVTFLATGQILCSLNEEVPAADRILSYIQQSNEKPIGILKKH